MIAHVPDTARLAIATVVRPSRSATSPATTHPIPPTEIAPKPANGAIAAAYDDARLRILRSLEEGEIDVAEAGRRLEALDSGTDGDDSDTEPDLESDTEPDVDGASDPDADADTARWTADERTRG